jgi:hypothetical protein
MITRRNFGVALAGLVAAPYVVRNSGVLMPVRERLSRIPLNYIVATRDATCPGVVRPGYYPAGTILAYFGDAPPDG